MTLHIRAGRCERTYPVSRRFPVVLVDQAARRSSRRTTPVSTASTNEGSSTANARPRCGRCWFLRLPNTPKTLSGGAAPGSGGCRALRAHRPQRSLGERVGLRCRIEVRMNRTSSVRNTSPNGPEKLGSRSRNTNRTSWSHRGTGFRVPSAWPPGATRPRPASSTMHRGSVRTAPPRPDGSPPRDRAWGARAPRWSREATRPSGLRWFQHRTSSRLRPRCR